MRRLIVDADDLGFTEGVNRGILEAHERGIVTSASLMVDRPGTAPAVDLASGARRLADGLQSTYTAEREEELRTLTDPQVRERVAELGIELVGFEALR